MNANRESTYIRIDYYLGHNKYAVRFHHHVPRQGDEVRFEGTVYKVKRVVWVEDEPNNEVRVAIDLTEITE
jgi:hypothetical protein